MSDWWQAITHTIAAEFSDVPDAAQVTRIVVRLGMAALLGGVLGWEREHAGKAAGVRTHMLVSMGAALFVLASEQSGIVAADNSRVLQGIIAGVGFLGAGTILKGDAEGQVRGLTTAAGIWLTAAIGVAAGLGLESTAVLSTVLALVVLWVIPMVHDLVSGRSKRPHALAAERPQQDAAKAAPAPSAASAAPIGQSAAAPSAPSAHD